MVRLVFRPYTQISRSICTSESLRASTRVSPGFALFRHSSPSFGSQHARSHSNLVPEETWSVDGAACASHLHSLSLRTGVFRPCTRGHVRLLVLILCSYVCFLCFPIHSGHQVRWTYQPGSHRRKVTQDF